LLNIAGRMSACCGMARRSWDWSGSPCARVMELVGFPDRNRKGIAASLPRLKALAEKRAATATA